MKKAFQILFGVAVFCLLMLPLSHNVLSQVDPENYCVDSSLTAGKTGSFESLADATSLREFEDALDESLGASAPYYDQLLLLCAQIQRTAIAQGAALAGFSVYPTFYGSSYFHDDSRQATGFIAYAADSSFASTIEKGKLVSLVNKTAEANPNVRFIFDVVYTGRTTEYNATYQLQSNPLTHEYIQEKVVNALSDDVLVVDDYPESLEDYSTGWFTTDHHWTPVRALASYNKMAQLMGWKEYDAYSGILVTGSWYGTYARMGLDMSYSSDFCDPDLGDFSNLKWYSLVSGQRFSARKTVDEEGNSLYQEGMYLVYDKYYGMGYCEAFNKDEAAEGTCLVICNSMARPIKDVIASNYAHTIVVDPNNYAVEETFRGLIEKYEPDDVVIIGLESSNFGSK